MFMRGDDMAKEALYRELGASFAESVKKFAKQSVLENEMPFGAKHRNTYGRLFEYADPAKRDQEESTYEKAMVEKHEKAD